MPRLAQAQCVGERPGRARITSPGSLRTCRVAPALGWAGGDSPVPGSSSPYTYLVGPPCQRRAAAGGWEGGRYRVPGHFLDTQMASGAWPGGKVTHSSGVRWPANLEVSLGPAQDTGPLGRTKGCGLGCSTPGSGLQAPASLPAVARPQRDPAPASGAGRSRPLSRPRPARESCRRPRPASLSRVGPHFPAGEGSRAARGRDDAGRAPPRRPAQIAFKTSASPPPTAGQGAGAGRGGRRRHVPPRRPAPRSLSCPPNSGPTFSISGMGMSLGTLGSCPTGIFTSTVPSPV